MKRYLTTLAAALSLAGCAGRSARAQYGYAEPQAYVYVLPVEHVVVVTRDVLVTRGWTVYRVERSGPNRIIWARRGDDQVVRIYANPRGELVVVHGLWEERRRDDRGKHKGWSKRGEPREIIAAINVRLKSRG
jgi:hypothetical protein